MNHLLALKGLLFMNFGEATFVDYATVHCAAVNTGSYIGRCNRVYNNAAITDQDIHDIKAYFGKTHFTWVVDSNDKKTLHALQANGLQHKASSPGMHLNLQALKENESTNRIIIKEISSEEDFLEWVSITATNYAYNKIELEKAVRFLVNRAPKGTLHLYLGYYENLPVASSMVAYHANSIISVHLVGTLAEYRNKGIGRAMLYQPLMIARDQGYSSALLMSSAMGLPLALKLGFEEYTHFTIYGNY